MAGRCVAVFRAGGCFFPTTGVRRGVIELGRWLAFHGLVCSVLPGPACGDGREIKARSLVARVIRLAGCGGGLFGVMGVAPVVVVLAGYRGRVDQERRACIRGGALRWGLCLVVVVFCAFWGMGGARRVPLPLVFVPHPAPVSFPVPGVVALSASPPPRC